MNTQGFDPRLANEPYPSAPGLWPVEAGARFAGMSARLLIVGIERGEIPVTLRRVGPKGKRFVNAGQLQTWVNEKPASPVGEQNLFEGSAQ